MGGRGLQDHLVPTFCHEQLGLVECVPAQVIFYIKAFNCNSSVLLRVPVECRAFLKELGDSGGRRSSAMSHVKE